MRESEVAEILKLPPEDRLRLVEIIWESLASAGATGLSPMRIGAPSTKPSPSIDAHRTTF